MSPVGVRRVFVLLCCAVLASLHFLWFHSILSRFVPSFFNFLSCVSVCAGRVCLPRDFFFTGVSFMLSVLCNMVSVSSPSNPFNWHDHNHIDLLKRLYPGFFYSFLLLCLWLYVKL